MLSLEGVYMSVANVVNEPHASYGAYCYGLRTKLKGSIGRRSMFRLYKTEFLNLPFTF